MYIMLCGYPPFNGDDDEEIIENVKNGSITFHGTSPILISNFNFFLDEEWAVISKEAKSLITRMLKRNPRNRISAKEALQDPWISSNVSSHPLKEKIFKNLTTFSVQSRFRHAIITFIASQMATKEDNQEMLEAFASLDTDGNGVLSKQELLTGYALFMPDSNQDEIEEVVDELIENLGNNKEDEVNFTEFVVAAMNREKLLNEKQIEKAFNMFDLDGNGFIDFQELKTAMSGIQLTDKEWKELIYKYDTDSDGRVSDSIEILSNSIDF